MLGTLLIVTLGFLFVREPAIDAMPRRNLGKLTFLGNFWEAITAHSHRPDYPAEIAVSSERERTSGLISKVNLGEFNCLLVP
jgi:hypothetical protein